MALTLRAEWPDLILKFETKYEEKFFINKKIISLGQGINNVPVWYL